MKKLHYMLFFIVASSCLNLGLAASEQHKITVSQCYISDDAVFLLIGTRWIGAEAADITCNGIFLKEEGEWLTIEEAIRCNNYWTWTCSNCGETNPQGITTCRKCGQ